MDLVKITIKNDSPSYIDTYILGDTTYELVGDKNTTYFDKIVLYAILDQLLHKNLAIDNQITVAFTDLFFKIYYSQSKFQAKKFDLILDSIKNWKAKYIRANFFSAHDKDSIKIFSIVDFLSINGDLQLIMIKFNDHYLKEIVNTKFYKSINFNEYKKLKTNLGMRLYEVLVNVINHKELTWSIDAKKLAQTIDLSSQDPSEIVLHVEIALKDINVNTTLKTHIIFDKKNSSLTFNRDLIPLYGCKVSKSNLIKNA